MGLGWTEILVIGAVVLIFLGGGNKLPEFARSLGEALNEFKKVQSGDEDEASPEPDRPRSVEDETAGEPSSKE